LREAGEISDAQDLFAFILPKVRQDFAVRPIKKLDAAPPKHAKERSIFAFELDA
jgi:hypothetical protein